MAKCCKHVITYGSGLVHQESISCHPLHLNRRSTLLVCNGVLCLTAFMVTSFATFSLVVEGSYVQGSSVEYTTLTLAISVIIPGIITLLSCSVVFIASNRRRLPHLYNTFRLLFAFAILFEAVMFIFGTGQLTQIEELTNSIVDWSLFIKYYQEEHIRNDLDIIQKGLKCCGFKSYKDWELNPYYSCKSTGYSRCSVPFSCCKNKTAGTSCVLRIRNPEISEAKLGESIYLDGCLKTSQMWYKHTVLLLNVSAILMALLQGLFLRLLYLVSGGKTTNRSTRKPQSNLEDSTKKTEYSSLSKLDTMIVKHVQYESII